MSLFSKYEIKFANKFLKSNGPILCCNQNYRKQR